MKTPLAFIGDTDVCDALSALINKEGLLVMMDKKRPIAGTADWLGAPLPKELDEVYVFNYDALARARDAVFEISLSTKDATGSRKCEATTPADFGVQISIDIEVQKAGDLVPLLKDLVWMK